MIEYDGIKFYKHSSRGYYISKANKKETRLHVYIYQQYYKCSILPGNDVHHKDFNKENNDPSNLQLMTRSEHTALHNHYKMTEETKRKLSLSLKGRRRGGN